MLVGGKGVVVMALCSQQFRVFCQLGLVASVHHPAFLGVVHLKKFHAHHGAAQYVSDRVDAVMNDNDRAVGAMADDREVLQDAGKITAEIAKEKAETEFEKYRIIQDRLFVSDFDKYLLELEENEKK